MSTYPISNVPRRVVFTASGVGPYAFTFEILADTDIAVYRDDTLLTLTSDYTVTINSNGTGEVTLTEDPAGATQIAIVGDRTIARSTDFTTGGDLFANTLNTELDSLTIFSQQNAEAVDRALKAPQTDPTTINMTLPRKADRAGRYMAFDSDGNPDVGPPVADVTVLAQLTNELATLAAISDDISEVAGLDAEVTTVANDSADIQALAAKTAQIMTIADDLAGTGWSNDLGSITDPATGPSASPDGHIVGVYNALDDIETVADDIANVQTVATDIANVNIVANNIDSVNTVSGDIAAIITAANDLNEAVSEIEVVANNIAIIDTVGNNITNVNTVSGISANVTTVAGISTNVTTVAGISGNVTTVAGISDEVVAVASDATDIGTVANIATEIETLANIATDVSAVEDIAGNVTTVANISDNVTTVAGISTNVTTVAGISANVTTVAGISSDVTTVAQNVADITNFSDVYLGPKSSAPSVRNDSTALQAGDLYFNTSDDQMKVFNGVTWQAAGSSVNGTSNRFRYVATAGQTTFSGSDANSNILSYDVGYIDVYLNGVRLDSSEYTATSGNSIVLAVATALDDELNIVAFGTFSVSNFNGAGLVDGTVTVNKLAATLDLGSIA